MIERKNDRSLIEVAAEQILNHLRTLDQDALVDASHDMDRAIRGEGYGELPLWLRGIPSEAVGQARQRMLSTLSLRQNADRTE